MTFRKNMVLIVGGSIAGILLLVTLFMLFRFRSKYESVNSDLRASQQRLDALYARDPFPSEENVLLVQTNLDVLQRYFDGFYGELKEGQIEPVKMEPAEFPLLLGKTMERLRTRAGEAGVALPSRFAFGFEHYAVGALPNAGDVPRLVIQVKTVEELCNILFNAKISEMVSVSRQVFEAGVVPSGDDSYGGGRRGGGRRRGPEQSSEEGESAQTAEYVDPSGLFSREHYILTFKGKDVAVMDVLNRFARSKMFVVVSRLDIANEVPLPKAQAVVAVPTVKSGPGGAASVAALSAQPKAEVPSHESRIVAGRELVKATLELDVYRFIAGESQEAQP